MSELSSPSPISESNPTLTAQEQQLNEVLKSLQTGEPTPEQVTFLQNAAANVSTSRRRQYVDGSVRIQTSYFLTDPETGSSIPLEENEGKDLIQYKVDPRQLPIYTNSRINLATFEDEGEVEIDAATWQKVTEYVDSQEATSAETLHVQLDLSPKEARAVFKELQIRGMVSSQYTAGKGYLVGRPWEHPAERQSPVRKTWRKLGKLILDPIKTQTSENMSHVRNGAIKYSGEARRRENKKAEKEYETTVSESKRLEQESAKAPSRLIIKNNETLQDSSNSDNQSHDEDDHSDLESGNETTEQTQDISERDTNQDKTTKADYQQDVRYKPYFTESYLHQLDERIGINISKAARQECAAQGIDRLRSEDFKLLSRSVRQATIRDSVPVDVPDDVLAEIELMRTRVTRRK